jgi:hypothetical protein
MLACGPYTALRSFTQPAASEGENVVRDFTVLPVWSCRKKKEILCVFLGWTEKPMLTERPPFLAQTRPMPFLTAVNFSRRSFLPRLTEATRFSGSRDFGGGGTSFHPTFPPSLLGSRA